MSDLIDVKSHSVSVALNLLLKDRTTEKNIIFATDDYDGIDFTIPITKKILFGNTFDVRPRVSKNSQCVRKKSRGLYSVMDLQ